MKRTPFLTAVAIATTLFVSCKNSGTSDLPIPKDAAVVLHVNSASLTSKLSWEEIKASGWFKDASENENDSFTKKLLENPENSGIDMKADIVLFIKKQGKGGYVVIEGSLKNASAFEAMVLKQSAGKKVEKDGDLNYVSMAGSSLVSWTDSKFFAMSDAPIFSQMNSLGGDNDYERTPFRNDSLKKFTKELIGLSSENSIANDDRFSDMLKESGDLHVWVNSAEYSNALSSGMFSMLKMNTLLQDNVSTFTLNFDNGKIAIKSTQHYGKEMAKIMEKYKNKNVEEAVINRIPSQNVLGAMAFNFDPENMKEILKATGLDGMANMFLGQVGYSLDELMNATKGQFMIAVSDFEIKEKQVTIPAYYQGDQPSTYTTKAPEMKVLFATSVNNKPSFDKLIGLATQKMSPEELSKVSFKTTTEWFAASNNAETVDKFLAGGNNKVPFADKISGHPFGMYLDLQKIIKAGGSAGMGNAADSARFNLMAATWQDVIGSGGEYKNGKASVEITINMVDKSTNSLKQLNQFADKMAAIEKKDKEERMKSWNDDVAVDSTVIAPVITEEPK